MTAVIYARYSSDNQREESIEGQIRECTAYAEKNGITVIKHYIDRALSAKTDNRPEFQQMIKDSEKRLFDIVLVWKLDRFARNRYDSAHYEYQLERNHVKLVSATEPISEGPAGIMVKSMLTGMAEYYSAELSEKVVRGMTENVLKGKYNGGTIPIGYTVDEEKFFQIDPLKAPFVVEAFQRYNDGATMKELMNWLNDSGVTTNRNQKFTYNSIQTLLTNRRYIGENRFKDIVMPDSIPVIIEKELFDSVQDKIAKNRRAPARHKAEDDYLLTTKLFCGMCGAMMFGECGTSRNKNVHHYYKCANAKRTKTCKKKTVRKEWLEDLVVCETMKMIHDDDCIQSIVDAVMILQEQENTVLPLLEKQMKDIENGIENLLNAIQAGVLTSSTKGRLEKLEAQQKELEIRIAEEKLAKPKVSADFVKFWLTNFRKLDPNVKSHRETLINTFVNAVYLYDEKVLITFNYKDGTKTITFDEIAAKDAPEGNGSDLGCFAPPKKHEILRLVLFLLPDGAISLVQFSAHLFPNLITPPIIDLRVNCKGSTGLCVSGFCGYCRHADIGIGQQNADEGVPEHMRMNFFNARLFSNTAYQCAIAIRVDRKTIVVADHEVVPTQIQKGLCVFGAFLLQILLPACTHQLLLGFPLCIIVLQEIHELRRNIHITDIAFLRCGKLIAIVRKDQQGF
jgi:DNA invertase Pin-like site-specific DNA recombinase